MARSCPCKPRAGTKDRLGQTAGACELKVTEKHDAPSCHAVSSAPRRESRIDRSSSLRGGPKVLAETEFTPKSRCRLPQRSYPQTDSEPVRNANLGVTDMAAICRDRYDRSPRQWRGAVRFWPEPLKFLLVGRKAVPSPAVWARCRPAESIKSRKSLRRPDRGSSNSDFRQVNSTVSCLQMGRAGNGGGGHACFRQNLRRWRSRIAGHFAALILAGSVLSASAPGAHAEGRRAVLSYICASYESARQVAVLRSWERPNSMPADCRILFGRDFAERSAEITEIVELIPTKDGRWIEIGKIRRNSVESGYSAGISDRLLAF